MTAGGARAEPARPVGPPGSGGAAGSRAEPVQARPGPGTARRRPAPRAGAGPERAGVIPVLKPPGMTSHDVVDACRRFFGLRRVGHAGTLDPAAAGVLVVCLGAATRLAEYLSDAPKAYRAEIWLGVTTDSLDSEGRVADLPPAGAAGLGGPGPQPPGPGGGSQAVGLDEGRLRHALARLTGPQLQVPPAVSAVRQGGERAYRRQRQGETVDLAPRPVTVYRFDLVAWWPGPVPRLLVDVVCSKGTYVRALARDLGAALGVPAMLAALIRTAQGAFHLDHAVTLEELAAGAGGDGTGPRRGLVAPAEALGFLPAWVLDPAEARRVLHGSPPRARPQPWDVPPAPPPGTGPGPAGTGDGEGPPERVRLLDPQGRLLAVAQLRRDGAGWRAVPEKVLPPEPR
ncbi:tRNA pseudouridine synthase B [Thermaerobacter litoralis]